MTRIRHLGLIAIASGILLIGGLVWLNREEPTFDLGNGWKASFMAVGVGELDHSHQSHTYRVICQCLPRSLQKRLPRNYGCYLRRDDDQLIIAFHLISPPNVDSNQVPFHPNIEIVDSRGESHLYPNMGGEWCGKEGYAIVVPNNTAQELALHFRVIDPKTKSIWYETTVRNPAIR